MFCENKINAKTTLKICVVSKQSMWFSTTNTSNFSYYSFKTKKKTQLVVSFSSPPFVLQDSPPLDPSQVASQ
jgi:hypothetical protein